MIEARSAEPAAALTARLARRAAQLAEARMLARLLARRGAAERRWRAAGLLWPLFGSERT